MARPSLGSAFGRRYRFSEIPASNRHLSAAACTGSSQTAATLSSSLVNVIELPALSTYNIVRLMMLSSTSPRANRSRARRSNSVRFLWR